MTEKSEFQRRQKKAVGSSVAGGGCSARELRWRSHRRSEGLTILRDRNHRLAGGGELTFASGRARFTDGRPVEPPGHMSRFQVSFFQVSIARHWSLHYISPDRSQLRGQRHFTVDVGAGVKKRLERLVESSGRRLCFFSRSAFL